jgi:hypothetical protein
LLFNALVRLIERRTVVWQSAGRVSRASPQVAEVIVQPAPAIG